MELSKKKKKKKMALFEDPNTDHQQERELNRKTLITATRHIKRINKKYDTDQAVAFGQLIQMARSGSEKQLVDKRVFLKQKSARAVIRNPRTKTNNRANKTQVAPTRNGNAV